MSPNTVRHLLQPGRRPTASKAVGYPTLDKLERVAAKLGCAVWELVHPDLERARALIAIGEAAELSPGCFAPNAQTIA